ncbi:hypothetical protein VF21_03131 [Pseudogymnoascus sp. 05NY08]|nr:hypothetical protein VF21_03131 [Pseudogymnoascus sp. 05NY08]
MEQISIYIARGLLIESTQPTWLYATASEHAVFYQYNFNGASNIFAGMLQTEPPYFQPTPSPPAPFEAVVGKFSGDPDYSCVATNEFSGCDESWAVIIRNSADIFIAGAGIYSWFSTYSQDCIDTQECQKSLMLLDSNFANIRIQNLVTIGTKYMAVISGEGILAIDNLNVKAHPYWSQVSILDVKSNGAQFNELIWIDPAIWEMDQPQFTCSPPCNVKIPPWTGATSTVNYPLLTVSDGTWTSTITKAPLTITKWVFDVVTLTHDGTINKNKRQGFEGFWPVLATTPYWPAVVYTGGLDGLPTTTAPTVPFPTPPPSIGTGAPAPPSGSWPKRFVQPVVGTSDSPWVNECAYFDFDCKGSPFYAGEGSFPLNDPYGDPGDDDENSDDLQTTCPIETTSTSSSSTKTTMTSVTTSAAPAPSPYETGNTMNNTVSCYGRGETTEHTRMVSAATSFCNSIENDDLVEGYFRSIDFPYPYNGGLGTVSITVSLIYSELGAAKI